MKMMTKKNKFLFFILIGLFTSCYHVPNQIQPSLQYSVDEKILNQLDSAFPLLTINEKQEDWGKEYNIAIEMNPSFSLPYNPPIKKIKNKSFLLYRMILD